MRKRGHRALVGFSLDPLRLGAIYILDGTTSAVPQSGGMAPAEAVTGLVRHAYATPLVAAAQKAAAHAIDSPQSLGAQFLRCADLARRVPVYRMTRGRSFAALNDMAGQIERRIIGRFVPDSVL